MRLRLVLDGAVLVGSQTHLVNFVQNLLLTSLRLCLDKLVDTRALRLALREQLWRAGVRHLVHLNIVSRRLVNGGKQALRSFVENAQLCLSYRLVLNSGLNLLSCLLPVRRECVLRPVVVVEVLNLLSGGHLAVLEGSVAPVEAGLALCRLLVLVQQLLLELVNQRVLQVFVVDDVLNRVVRVCRGLLDAVNLVCVVDDVSRRRVALLDGAGLSFAPGDVWTSIQVL